MHSGDVEAMAEKPGNGMKADRGKVAWGRSHTALAVVGLMMLASCGVVDEETGTGVGESAMGELTPTMAGGDGGTLVVADEPEVIIGAREGAGPYNLVSVTGALRLSDGRVVVADCGSKELRYFDASGQFLRSVGGAGEGPGEFTWLRRVFRMGGDSVAAFDTYQGRITVFSPNGSVARVVTVPVTALMLDVMGQLSSGSFVARRFAWGTPPEGETMYRGEVRLLTLDRDGEFLDSIGGLEGVEFLVPPGPNGPYIPPNFARSASVAVEGLRIFYGAQDDAGIVEFDGSLTKMGVTRTTTRASPVTEDLRELVESMTDEQAYRMRLSRYGAFAAAMPAFRDFVAGSDGKLWVQDPEGLDGLALHWTAYAGGSPVSRVELPARFFPFQFGPDWVLGVAFDELDVQQVMLHRLISGDHSETTVPLQEGFPPKSSCTWQASR